MNLKEVVYNMAVSVSIKYAVFTMEIKIQVAWKSNAFIQLK